MLHFELVNASSKYHYKNDYYCLQADFFLCDLNDNFLLPFIQIVWRFVELLTGRKRLDVPKTNVRETRLCEKGILQSKTIFFFLLTN